MTPDDLDAIRACTCDRETPGAPLCPKHEAALRPLRWETLASLVVDLEAEVDRLRGDAGMTPDDLAAIRARDADDIGWMTMAGASAWVVQLRIDVRALLAEVDRLEALVTDIVRAGTLPPDASSRIAAAERARIRAAVEGLATWRVDEWDEESTYRPVDTVARAAVLAAIDGEESK